MRACAKRVACASVEREGEGKRERVSVCVCMYNNRCNKVCARIA